MLEEAALHGKDWITFKRVREVFSNAGAGADLDPFTLLVKLGLWSEDENVRLRAEKVPVEFGALAQAEALEVAEKSPPPSDVLVADEEIIAVDSVFTRDVDDALSLSYEGEDLVVGIHITDVSHFVEHDSPLDLASRERATSLYLADLTIPMLPPILSERAASLAVGEARPAISMMVRFGSDLRRKDFRICSSVVRVSERLSYEEADERIRDSETKEAKLFAVARALREGRAATGALIFRDPELTVRVEEDGRIDVSVRDRETPAQILVSEMMILANSLFALFLKEHGLPGIFRIQPPPSERIDLGDRYDPVASYRCRKTLVRSDIGVDPGPHSTLGLDAYATATSPLRRYPDLLLQRQVKSFLERGEPLLDRNELEKILVETSYPLDRAVSLERERQRYFLLKYLQQRKDEEFEAIVLQRFPKFHLVQITELVFNAPLSTPNSLSLNPYDQALIRIEKVNPREDKLSLSLVKLLEDHGQ
jgi:exoribonuclease-2